MIKDIKKGTAIVNKDYITHLLRNRELELDRLQDARKAGNKDAILLYTTLVYDIEDSICWILGVDGWRNIDQDKLARDYHLGEIK